MARVIYFAIGPKSVDWGSTYLRVTQLSQLIRLAFDKAEREVMVVTTLSGLRDCDIVVTKSFLLESGIREIMLLRGARNRLFVDFVDQAIKDDICVAADTLIASSKLQYKYFLMNYPTKRSFYLFHHVDVRIPDVRCQADTFRAAYFGDIKNIRYGRTLESNGHVNIFNASGANNSDWMQSLRDFNCHYLPRITQTYDGFKPFIKGFIAAKCGALPLVSLDDLEAKANLPADYPFFFNVCDEASASDAIRAMRDAFGGAEWRYALTIIDDLRYLTSETRFVQLLRLLFS